MNQALEETVRKAAEYSRDEKKQLLWRMRLLFAVGTVSLLVPGMLTAFDLRSTDAGNAIVGFASGLALGTTMVGLLYTSRFIGKLTAFKKRLFHVGKSAD